jgi:DNA-binding NtrC family response regulator
MSLQVNKVKKILLTEEDNSVRDGLAKLLKKEGYQIAKASSSSELIKKINESSFDLILVDVHLGQPEGIEVLKVLRDTNPGIPILAMVSHTSGGIVEKALKEGVIDYLIKPFNITTIKKKIAKILKENQPKQGETSNE